MESSLSLFLYQKNKEKKSHPTVGNCMWNINHASKICNTSKHIQCVYRNF